MVGVTGVGSLPGTDYPAALRLVLDALAGGDDGLPYLPELPSRGPWADLIGRACALLVDLPVSLDAGVWRLSDTAGLDARRARTTLRDDLDMLQEQAHDWTGRFKVQVAGPWTLATALFRPLGGRVLADRGARRDLAQSLAQGTSDLLADVRGRLPGAELVLQVDEPALPAVLAGAVPTEGGYFRHRSIDAPEAAEALGALAAVAEAAVLHCCGAGLPVALVAQAGFKALSVDQDQIAAVSTRSPGLSGSFDGWDAVAEFVDAGGGLYLGCLPTNVERAWGVDELVSRVLRVLRPLELGAAVADSLVLTPACGLAGFSPRGASAATAALLRAAPLVDERLRR